VWRRLYSIGRYLLVAFFVLILVILVWATATRPQRQAVASLNALINSLDTEPTFSQLTTLNREVYRREMGLGADPLDTNSAFYKLENSVTNALRDWNNPDDDHHRAELGLIRACAEKLCDEGARREPVMPPEISTRTGSP
jgi:hypothetical protein